MSDQKKQPKSTDSKVIIGDVKKSLKEQEEKQDFNISIGKIGENGSVTVDIKDAKKKSPRHIFLKKRVLFVSVVLIVVILVSVLGFVLWQKYNDTKSNQSSEMGINGMQQQPIMIEEALAGANKDNAQMLVDKLGSEAQKTKNKKQKAQYYSAMTQIELNYGNPSKAVEYAQQAIALYTSAVNYGLLGYSALATGNYKLASDSFAKAASLSEKTDSSARSPYNDYLELQKQAEAKV